MSMTPAQLTAGLTRLAGRTRKATEAAERAQKKLDERDELAAKLADGGARYADLAAAMGITVDGVTYVLRKVRRSRQTDRVDA